ncbi:MAG: aminotransferase class III-fold pyridoxal phosphate-dependent enzyme, partial [Exilispira sp.]
MLFKPLGNMMNKTLQKILQKKYEYFCKGDKDSYFYYIFDLPQMIINFIPSFFYIISFGSRVIFSFVYVFLIFPFPLLLSFIFFLFFQYFLQLRQKKEIEYWKISNEKSKNLTNLIIQYLRAIWTVKVYSLQKFCYDKIKSIEEEYSKSLTLFHFLNKLYFILVNIYSYFFQIIFILFIVIFNHEINIGRIIISLFFYETFTNCFSILLLNLKEIKQNSRNAQDLINIIEDDDNEKEKLKLLDASLNNNDLIISLKNYSFVYKRENQEISLFDNISLEINKKDKIVIFANSFHGTFDGVLGRNLDNKTDPVSIGTTNNMVSDLYILEYGTDESIEFIKKHADELAAVMAEPVQTRNPSLQPVTFLKEIEKIANEKGFLLIFDETVTGFRAHSGGIQKLFNINA